MIRFQCPRCSATMRASETEAGEKRRCPKCDVTFRIPGANVDAKPSAVTEHSEGQRRRARKKPARRQEELIPVVCGVCQTRVYAKLNQVGTSVECPDCFTPNLVKKPAKKPQAVPVTKMSGYDLAPAQEINIIKDRGAEKLLEAEQQVEQEIEEAPKVPDNPFVDGIYMYPFRPDVLPILIGMGMSWTFFLLLLNWAWGLEGMASAVAPVILGGIAFLFVLVVVPSFVTFLRILENGANGDDESDVRPDGGMFAMVDWVVDILPVIIAATISCLPTLGVYHTLQYLGGDLVPRIQGVAAFLAYLSYLIFPVIILSMLENNSALGFFSAHVWGSLRQRSGPWIKFFLAATALCIPFAGVIIACQRLWALDLSSNVICGTILAMSVLLCGLAIYFRLLGRLAFVLTNEDPKSAKDPSGGSADRLNVSTSGA